MINTITFAHEAYVSLKTAQLLKKAGFDWEVIAYYQNENFVPYCCDRHKLTIWDFNNAPNYMETCSVPTLTVAQKWLKEVQNIEVFVNGRNYSTTYEEALEIRIIDALLTLLKYRFTDNSHKTL